jgi:anti-anti-sigma regulatory factor
MQLTADDAQDRAVLRHGTFSHDHARAVSRWALRPGRSARVVIDFRHAPDATTAAFAALVLLRRQLLAQGRDLRLEGLGGRAYQVYCVNRLETVLPQVKEQASAMRIAPTSEAAACEQQQQGRHCARLAIAA